MTLRFDDMTEHEFRLIREVVNRHCGIWVPDQNRTILARKLSRLLEDARVERFYDYYHLMKYGNGDDLERAIEAIVNNESYFFREVAQLHALVELVRDARPNPRRAIRILSAGCSTGEEPYTIAMLLDNAGLFSAGKRVEIHGVDISARALDKARAASYTSGSFRGAEGQYLDWYFKPVGGRLQLDEHLRRRVSFSRQNLRHPEQLGTLGMFDVVLCRNVIIYFDKPNKLRTIEGLTSILREGGHIFMGHSESLYSITNALEMTQVKDAIAYRKPIEKAVGCP